MTEQFDELQTDGGPIYVPKPDNGHPIGQVHGKMPGLVFNVAAPTDEDLEVLAARVTAAQESALRGEAVGPLMVRDAMYGEPAWLTPTGLLEITYVGRAFAKVVDISAQAGVQQTGNRQFRRRIHVPG